ncbi:MAG: hypothetical protein ACW99A_19985 [Candidatus Kariarchaeaceae archaeon]|jgi:hypothetical protein
MLFSKVISDSTEFQYVKNINEKAQEADSVISDSTEFQYVKNINEKAQEADSREMSPL